MSSQLIWIVTGAATGLGRAIVEAALQRGDKAIATAHAPMFGLLSELKTKGADVLELDVTASVDDLKAVAAKAIAIHGRVDVLVNNAGFVMTGAIEESSPEQVASLFNTNLFGALNVARAFLPHFRERKSGTIVWTGSLAGHQATPGAAVYSASKAAMRSFSAALNVELSTISPNLRSTVIDYGYLRTAFLQPGHRQKTSIIADYNTLTTAFNSALAAAEGHQPGDPVRCAKAVVDIVKGEDLAAGKPWPGKGVRFGSDTYKAVIDETDELLKDTEAWKELTFSTDFLA